MNAFFGTIMVSFLSSLDTLESINHHRKLLTKHKMRISDATHMSDLIPLINRNEVLRGEHIANLVTLWSVFRHTNKKDKTVRKSLKRMGQQHRYAS